MGLVSNDSYFLDERADHLISECPTLNMCSIQASFQILDDAASVRAPTVATAINDEIGFRHRVMLSWPTQWQLPLLLFRLKTTDV